MVHSQIQRWEPKLGSLPHPLLSASCPAASSTGLKPWGRTPFLASPSVTVLRCLLPLRPPGLVKAFGGNRRILHIVFLLGWSWWPFRAFSHVLWPTKCLCLSQLEYPCPSCSASQWDRPALPWSLAFGLCVCCSFFFFFC